MRSGCIWRLRWTRLQIETQRYVLGQHSVNMRAIHLVDKPSLWYGISPRAIRSQIRAGNFEGGITSIASRTSVRCAISVRQCDTGRRPILWHVSLAGIFSTDPPYFDNVGYADLSDFFYVWLRRALRLVFPDLFATLAVPKAEELVATPYRHGSKDAAESFFLDGMVRRQCDVLPNYAHPDLSGHHILCI